MSDYLNYYQGKKWLDDPGRATKLYYKTTHSETTRKQAAFHKALVNFMESKGLDTTIFKRYKGKRDCAGKIHGMITTIKKSDYADEFFNKRGGEQCLTNFRSGASERKSRTTRV